MPSLNASSGTIFILQILTSAFLAVLFLQSGIDKIVDRRGNLEFLQGHFAKSPLSGMVPLLVMLITILELLAGVLSAIGCVLIIVMHEPTVAFYGAVISALFHSRPLFRSANGQRLRRCGRSCSLFPA